MVTQLLRLSSLLFFLLPILMITPSHAESSGQHSVSLKLGGAYYLLDSNFDVDLVHVDYEDDLNLKEDALTINAELMWQFKDRHYLAANFISIKRQAATSTLEKSFSNPFSDTAEEFEAGVTVNSYLNTDIYQASYGYEFLKAEDWGIGASIGLHLIKIETEIKGVVDITAGGETHTRVTAYEKANFPLPNIGLFAHYTLTNDWHLATRAQYFYINTDYLQGGLTELHVSTAYQVFENWSVEGSIHYGYINFTEYYPINTYKLAYSYYGPSLSVVYSF